MNAKGGQREELVFRQKDSSFPTFHSRAHTYDYPT